MKIKMYFGFRFLKVSLFSIIAIIILVQLNELRIISKNISYQQTEKFSYSLTNLAAAEASRYLSQKKNKDLKILINELSTDPMVRDATIYDQLGVVLYQSNSPLSLPALLKIYEEPQVNIDGIIPYIAELYNEGTKIGYIRISLRQDHILNIIFNYQQETLEILILLLSLAFIAGAILMALFFNQLKFAYFYIEPFLISLLSSCKIGLTKLRILKRLKRLKQYR